jgi:histone deacetylase complex regulatory component SIN3
VLCEGDLRLFQGFNPFLPAGYQIHGFHDPIEDKQLTITTPMGTLTRPNNGVFIPIHFPRDENGQPAPITHEASHVQAQGQFPARSPPLSKLPYQSPAPITSSGTRQDLNRSPEVTQHAESPDGRSRSTDNAVKVPSRAPSHSPIAGLPQDEEDCDQLQSVGITHSCSRFWYWLTSVAVVRSEYSTPRSTIAHSPTHGPDSS